MIVHAKRHAPSVGRHRLAPWWPILLSLLIVLVPTVCVLWFMTQAVENRRLVVRRLLADADFAIARERINGYWQARSTALETNWQEGQPAAEAFQRCVLGELADSLVCFAASGELAYPAPARAVPLSQAWDDSQWAIIESLEYVQGDLARAATAYRQLAARYLEAADGDRREASAAGQALLGAARCLAKAGEKEAAIRLLTDTLGQPRYREAVDLSGRLIRPAAQLRALELIGDRAAPRFRAVLQRLAKQLNDYTDPGMAAPQRLFLMKQVRRFVLDRQSSSEAAAASTRRSRPADLAPPLPPLAQLVDFPTLDAEQLASEFCDANPRPSKDTTIRMTQSPGIWQLASPNRRSFGLYRTESVVARSRAAIAARGLKSGATVTPVPPGGTIATTAGRHTAEAGKHLPGWRLVHAPATRGGSGADARIVAYFWTGVLVITVMSIFAALIAYAFRRQMRLTRLRNDLVATVSHELKTPLASIRLLVDTLLDDRDLHEPKVREYLGLVAKENMRLSRLIDNFLAFSRMERNKHAFQFTEVNPADVVRAAVEAAGERLHTTNCQLDIDMPPDLPPLQADNDTLVTALLNLLDNAYKYTGDKKHIRLRVDAQDGNVRFAVSDNGIGMTRAAARKVFKRFYQADRRVARSTGGVGLGLSIVQFIVHAHHGNVQVDSRPGQGTTLTIMVPIAPDPAPANSGG